MAKFFLQIRRLKICQKFGNILYEIWSENQADKYYAMLIDSCEQLSDHPGMGKSYNEIGHDKFA